ncbi:MAG: UbiA family prenyltransferase [Actinomycetales bacterium]
MRHTAVMSIGRALARACHPVPTVAVTGFILALAWALGWPAARLVGLAVVVLIGQLSVGWSNDAHDADLDRVSARLDKPAATGQVRTGVLWVLAAIMLAGSVVGSWWVAGWLGGTFHIVALVAAWAYNLGLSRTVWSGAAYLVAFGCVPAFLAYGLDGQPPARWLVLVAAMIGLSGHLANAGGDIQADAEAGQGGLAVRLGARSSFTLCWTVLAFACTLLAAAGFTGQGWAGPVGAVVVLAGFVAGLTWSKVSGRPRDPFHAVLAVTAVDLLALIWVVRSGA